MSVHLRKDGRWAVAWREEGRQVWRYFGRGEAAEARAREFDRKQSLERRGPAGSPSLAELAHLYLKANRHHRRTRLDIIRYVNGAPCVERPAALLTRADLTAFRAGLGDLSPTTKNRAQGYLRRILQWGVEQGQLLSNPWANLPKLKETRRVPTATLAEFHRIMAAVDSKAEHLRWALKVILATANRPGLVEVFRLRWENLDLDHGVATLRQGKSGALKISHLPPWFLAEARERRADDLSKGIPWVVHRLGKPITNYRRSWLTAKRKAGLGDRDIRFYDIRHALATELLRQGADPVAVQHQLGHTSLTTTLKFYPLLLEHAQRRAAAMVPAPEPAALPAPNTLTVPAPEAES